MGVNSVSNTRASKWGRGSSPTRILRVLLPVVVLAGMAAPFIGIGAAAASTTLDSVTVGPQSGTVTYAGGTVTFPVTVVESHGGSSYHDINVTGVSDTSVTVTYGTAPACQQTISSKTSYSFTLTVNVPAGDTPGTYTTSLVATAIDYNSTDGSCSGGTDHTLASSASGGTNGTLTIGQATQSVSITSTAPSGKTYSGSNNQTYAVAASATSGLAVALTIDAASTSGCTIAGTTVSYGGGVGTCIIDANQAGNTDYSAATQVQQSFSVGKATQTVSITSTAPSGKTYSGSNNQTYAVAASATSGLAVALTIDAASTSGCTIAGTTVSYGGGVGTCIIDANQAGNTDYSAATQVQQSFTIGVATPTVSISNLPASGTYGGSFTPTYTVTSGDTGTTSVTSNSTSICTVTSGTVNYVGVGTCSLTAHVAATTDYAAASGSAQTFTIGVATPTVSISNLPASGTYGGSFTPTYTVTSGDTGTTSVTSNSTSICTVTSGTVNYVGVGTCSLTAAVTATTDYAAASGSAQTFTIGVATPTVSISNLPASGTYGGSFTPTYTVTSGDTGTTSVTSNSTSICTVTSGTVNYVGVGTCSLTAAVTATTDYAAASGSAQTFTIGVATPTVSISNLPASGTYGGSFTPTYTVTSGDTGTTSVTSNSTSICTVTSGTVNYVGVGACSLTAHVAATTDTRRQAAVPRPSR